MNKQTTFTSSPSPAPPPASFPLPTHQVSARAVAALSGSPGHMGSAAPGARAVPSLLTRSQPHLPHPALPALPPSRPRVSQGWAADQDLHWMPCSLLGWLGGAWSRLERGSRCSDHRSQGVRKQEVMPSSSDNKEHLAVTCDFNVSIVSGAVSPKAWDPGSWHLSILTDSASINKPPNCIGNNPSSPSVHSVSCGRSQTTLGGHSRHW